MVFPVVAGAAAGFAGAATAVDIVQGCIGRARPSAIDKTPARVRTEDLVAVIMCGEAGAIGQTKERVEP
jgi:hypothetical protein